MESKSTLDMAREVFRREGLAGVRRDVVPGAASEFETDAELRQALLVDAARRLVVAVEGQVSAAADGPAALDAFIGASMRHSTADPLDVAIHLSSGQPGGGSLLEPTEAFRRAMRASGQAALGDVERRLVEEWGEDLPLGIHPRRLVFLAYTAVIGITGVSLTAANCGESMRHDVEHMIDEMCRALSAPTRTLRQLTALNAVASEMASLWDEAALVARVPTLLCTSLELTSALLVVPGPVTRGRDELVVRSHARLDGRDGSDALAAVTAGRLSLLPHYRRALESRQTMFVAEPTADPSWPTPTSDEERRWFSDLHPDGPCIVGPITCKGEVVGVLGGHVARGGRRLDRRDVPRFETFATLVGLALDNARWVSVIQAEKMAALSRLVAGVAHELNTPLGALVSSASAATRALERLRQAIDEGDTERVTRVLAILEESQQTSLRAGSRIGERVQALRNFARLDESERKRVDLHEGIDSALTLLASQLEHVTVDKRYGELPHVECFPNELNQVFMNLILNAATAIEGRGTLTVTTARDGDAATIAFQDDGCGMAGEQLGRCFEPGFTRWGVGVGAGLGLSTCLQTVKRHGGRLDVESALGRGSTFTVVVPLSAP